MNTITDIVKVTALVFLCISGLIGCTNSTSTSRAEANHQEETPEVLTAPSNSYDVLQKSSRYSSDLIAALYKEALSKDPMLKKLDHQIQDVAKMQTDSLKAYTSYMQTNARYWNTAHQYAERIQEAEVRSETKTMFHDLAQKHQQTMLQYEQKIDSIHQEKIRLEDQYIQLQLAVTHSMIVQYQKNEKPALHPIQIVLEEYQKLNKSVNNIIKNEWKK